jgi:hypothetical protein
MRNATGAIQFLVLFIGLAVLSGQSNAATAKVNTRQAQGAERNQRQAKHVVYKSNKYRFRFFLPPSWKGYSILVSEWSGDSIQRDETNQRPKTEQGPVIIIRHPLWTKANLRQDIPIMVFTRAQWDEADNFIFDAGPFGPGEIGRNAKYVFALPPRYNYADVDGVEEVNEIFQHDPLHPF